MHTTIESDLECWNWDFGQYVMSEGFSSALESSLSATVERLDCSQVQLCKVQDDLCEFVDTWQFNHCQVVSADNSDAGKSYY